MGNAKSKKGLDRGYAGRRWSHSCATGGKADGVAGAASEETDEVDLMLDERYSSVQGRSFTGRSVGPFCQEETRAYHA
jgi:hypothetical protein